MSQYKVGDKVVVVRLLVGDFERGIRIGHVAKVLDVRYVDSAAYCQNPEWDYKGLQRQSIIMLSHQIEKCEGE